MTEKRAFYGSREFDTPEDLGNKNLWDALDDVFTTPEDLSLVRPDYGFMARVRDGHRIREYFRKSLANLGLKEEDESVSRSR